MILPLPLIAALLGAVLGWWPLARWTERVLLGDERTGGEGDEHGSRPHAVVVRFSCATIAAIGFGLFVWRFGLMAELPALLAFAAASAVLGVVDVSERRLPNEVIGWFTIALVVLLVFASAATGQWIALLWALLGGLGMFGAYLMLALITPSAMGMGDVKLAAPLGMLLAWFGLNAWVLGLFGGFVIGGLVSLIALAARRVTLRGSIPFGPSMLVGVLVALLLIG